MKAVIYARTDTADPTLSARQIENCRARATEEGLEVVEVFEDIGNNGATLERPGLQALREYVQTHDVQAVVCSEFARLARRAEDAHMLLAQIRELGLGIYCTVESLTSRSPLGRWVEAEAMQQQSKGARKKPVRTKRSRKK